MGIEHISGEPSSDDRHIRGLDSIEVGGLKLYGVTRGGVETCLMVTNLPVPVMFDVGMVPPGALKAPVVLVSHGHADHLAGLHYLLAQRSLHRLGTLEIHAPAEIVPDLEIILAAWTRLEGVDARPYLYLLEGNTPGDRFQIGGHLTAVAFRSTHRVPSLAWMLERTTKKLMPEFVGRQQSEIVAAREAGEIITYWNHEPLLCVTGDTQIELWDQHPEIRACKVLVHEVTSWTDTPSIETTRMWGHTHVDEIIARSEQFTGEALVLVHRSMRHTRAEAEHIVRTRFPATVRDRVHVFGH